MSQKILLADDSVTIQKVVELTFMDEGLEVISVGSGTDALARLEHVAPDVLIADVHMPGATGYEVCRQAKARRPALPVLLLVGTFEPFDKDEVAACGANGFLKKPFDSQELVRQVRELLEAASPEAAAEEPEPAAAMAPAAPAPVPVLAAVPPAAATVAPADLDATTPGTAPAVGAPAVEMRLSDADVDRIARRVVEILSEKVVREVSWEVVPDLAELIIKDRLRELESQVE